MNILITGATGFLGSHIVKRLISENHQVVCLKRKTSDMKRIIPIKHKIKLYNLEDVILEKVFVENDIDAVIHTATNYATTELSIIDTIQANLALPIELILLAKNNNCKFFINTDTILDKRVSHYSLSKKQFIDWFKLYSKDITCLNIQLEHFYGPSDNQNKFTTFIIHQLIHNVPKIDLTFGEQKRDFIFIDDVVSAFIFVINNYKNFQFSFKNFEVGTNNPISIKEFVLLAKKICNNHKTFLNFGALDYRENEPMVSSPNTSDLRELGWEPKVFLKEGLEKTIHFEKGK